MAKSYLEIIEQLTDEEMLTKQVQIVRLEVKDEQEAKEKADLYEGVFEGLNYKKFFHVHRVNKEEGCIVNEL